MRRQQPGPEVLARIAAALGTTSEALLGIGEQPLDQAIGGLVARFGGPSVVQAATEAAFKEKV